MNILSVGGVQPGSERQPFMMESRILLEGAECWCRVAKYLYEALDPESPFEIEKKAELFDVIRNFHLDRLHALLGGMNESWPLSERLLHFWNSYKEQVWLINNWRHTDSNGVELICLVVSSGKFLSSLVKATLAENGLLDRLGGADDVTATADESYSGWMQPRGEA